MSAPGLVSEVARLPPLVGSRGGKKFLATKADAPGSFEAVLEEQPDSSLLRCLFGSAKSIDLFRNVHFQRQPVVCTNAAVKPLKSALHNLNVRELLQDTASDQIHVWIPRADTSAMDSITVEDPEQAFKLYMAGHSLYCRAPASVERVLVSAALSELKFGVVSSTDRFRRGEVETFFSRKGHVTDYHTDFQENFTVQLAGRKEWHFVDSTATHPVRGCTPHFNDEKERDVIEQQLKVLRLGDAAFSSTQICTGQKSSVVLEPGDILYHPAGIWHKVVCLDDSISINISLTGSSYAEVFCSSLQQVLMENRSWRAVVSADQSSAHATMQHLLSALPALCASLSPSDLLPLPALHAPTPMQSSRVSHGICPVAKKEEDEEEEEDEEGEDEEEEGEEDEEEGKGSQAIHVEDMDIMRYKELLTCEPVGRKRKAAVVFGASSESEPCFYINPLAVIVGKQEIRVAVQDDTRRDADSVWYVHCGFGNETLESLVRSVVRVPSRLQWAWELLHQLSVSSRNQRIASFNREGSQDWTSAAISLSELRAKAPKSARSSDLEHDLMKVLLAAWSAGLLSKL